MPSWITRWGITVILMVLISIILGCFFIKVPETISTTATVDSLAFMDDFSIDQGEGLHSFTITTDIPQSEQVNIQAGQDIILRFTDAIIKGIVMGVAPTVETGGEMVLIIKVVELASLNMQRIAFVEGMEGSAEIIVRDHRLIDYIFSNNSR